ncbi:transporter substrate-binding domain-containing protein, partial [Paraburkholderia sp. SIMBA_030]
PGGTNERFAKQFFPHANQVVYPDNVTIFKQILAGKADVMVTDASETLLQQKLNPGLCAVHPDKPFQYGEKAWLVPRGDV